MLDKYNQYKPGTDLMVPYLQYPQSTVTPGTHNDKALRRSSPERLPGARSASLGAHDDAGGERGYASVGVLWHAVGDDQTVLGQLCEGAIVAYTVVAGEEGGFD